MSKCIDCGANFVGTPESPPPEGMLCKSCEIKRLKAENARLEAAVQQFGQHHPRCSYRNSDQCDCGWLSFLDERKLTPLRDLLAPTIELLTRIKEFQGRYAEPYHREIVKELTRLRGIVEGK